MIHEGEQHNLQTAEGGRLPLFPKRGGREASLPVPPHVLGCSGGRVKVRADGGSLVLEGISELRVPTPSALDALLEHRNGPYGPLLDWLADLFTRNGWRLGPNSLPTHYHFAFELEPVRISCPDLLNGVPFLERGQEEADLVLWCDRSHGIHELETMDSGIAKDIFYSLSAAQKLRRLYGESSSKHRSDLGGKP